MNGLNLTFQNDISSRPELRVSMGDLLFPNKYNQADNRDHQRQQLKVRHKRLLILFEEESGSNAPDNRQTEYRGQAVHHFMAVPVAILMCLQV